MTLNLAGLLKAGGAGFQGYGQDKQRMAAEAVQASLLERQRKQDAIAAAIQARAAAKPDLIASLYPKARGGDLGAQGQMIGQDAATYGDFDPPKPVVPARDPVADHAANRTFDIANPLPRGPVGPDLTPTIGPAGTPVWGPKVAGGKIPGASATPRMARAPTEAQEKSYRYFNLMKNAEPEIEATMSSGKVRPAAVSAYFATTRVPLAGGVLADLANSGLNAEEQRLIRAGHDFTTAVKRPESGAAVNNKEVAETLSRYFPGMFGDKPELTEAKKKARAQYMGTMELSALPATSYYQQVKDQGNPEIDPAAEAGDPGGGNVAPARKVGVTPAPLGSRAAAEAHLKAQGKTAQQILQILGPP